MKVVFEFPDDAWQGIVASLSEGSFQEHVPNPAYDGSDPSVPPYIVNPLSREDHAIQVVKNFVADRYRNYAAAEAMRPVQEQINQQVAARASQVDVATTVSFEA